jgi:segregation and condensation protein B
MDVMEEQQEPQSPPPSAESDPPKKRSRKRAPIADDGATEAPEADAAAPEATEAPDGAVQDSADSEDDSNDSAASDVQIDLRTLEALLFSTHHPLTAGRLAEMLELESTKPIRRAIKELNEQYVAGDRSFRVEQVAGGYQLLTLPEFGEVLKKLHQREVDAKLTKAALETLAIIAYKQPILRVDIEAIRGVACGETIRSLMEKHLVKIAGRAEVPGRPILYGTTRRFLELFGLNSTKDLPQSEQTLANANPPSTS